MLLTITTTYQPASELGYLLHKHPNRVQSFELTFGKAHVVYPDVSEDRCTVALLLEINSVQLVRRGNEGSFALEQYVNDRPYAASSFLSVAIAQVFSSALNGKSKDHAELVETLIPLEACLTSLPCRGGEPLLRRLFEPLGYAVTTEQYPLDTAFPTWGQSRYFTVTLKQTIKLQDLLSHLYVLIPVLDDDKHYYVGSDEVEKLLRHGEGWLNKHPDIELITRRYLRHKHNLTTEAMTRLIATETPSADATATPHDREETVLEETVKLHQQRLGAVFAVLKQSAARRVVDLGCGEGRLLAMLLKDAQFTEILGMDVSHRVLEIASSRLKLEQLPPLKRQRIQLIHSSLMYRDARLSNYDAAAVVEVIEHLDPPRLSAFERVLFEFARPKTVAITTPNAEYNVKWESLPAGNFRHKDHRFEWKRAEFQTWAEQMCSRYGYKVRFLPIGDVDSVVGAASQMGVFELVEAASI